MIKAILFDMDDTLFEFDACARAALRGTLVQSGILYQEEWFDVYIRIDRMLWKKRDEGLLSMNEVMVKRFELFFQELSLCADAAAMNRLYLDNLGNTCIPENGADNVLRYLYSRYNLYVASNGVFNTQIARLKKSGYLKYFKDLFVSDRIGIEKPEKGFFDTCLGKMGYEADQVIIIGDGILSDISGGINAGMNTCWYNRKRERGPEGIVPQYEILHLEELLNIL